MASSKVVLVTGGNSGIGYETVKALLQSGAAYRILLGSRSLEKGRLAAETLRKECSEATNTVEAIQIDLSSDESIETAFENVKANPERLDVLINNAGATFDLEFLAGRTSLRSRFNAAYDVNVAGTNVVTWTFMPLLLQSPDPRLIFVAGLSLITKAAESGAYFPPPPLPTGWPKHFDFDPIGYRCSKVALNMLMLDWNHKLKADGVKVWAVAPGFLATNLGGIPERAKAMGAGHPSAGGDIIRRVVEGERDSDVGQIVEKNGGIIPW